MGNAALKDDVVPVTRESRVGKLRDVLESQHAIHGIVGAVFERCGGEDFMYEWAIDHPGQFIKLMCGMTPGMAPTQGMQGDVVLHIHQSLGVSELDDVIEEQ